MKAFKLTDERKAELDKLIEDLNTFVEDEEKYTLSPESACAGYVSDFGYGEGKINLDNVTDEARELIALIPKGKERSILQECATVEQVNVFYVENEVFRVMLGEVEYQIEDALLSRVEALSPEEHKYVQRHVDAFMHPTHKDLLYTNHDYDGFALVLDEEKLTACLVAADISIPKE